MKYVWTEKYDVGKITRGINVCGSDVIEGKFSSYMEIVIPHIDSTLLVSFGSSLIIDDPFDGSFGISNF